MPGIPFGLDLVMVGVALLIAFGVIAFLYSLASRLRFEIDLHELRVAAHSLRRDHQRRVEAIQSGNVELGEINVEVVE